MDFNKKQKGRFAFKKFYLKIAVFAAFFLAVFLVVADIKIYKHRKELEKNVAKYENQIQELRNRNKNLEDEIENSDNPDYIEKVAREEQGMQKPGENVVSFVMPEDSSSQEQNAQQDIWQLGWLSWLSNFLNQIKEMF